MPSGAAKRRAARDEASGESEKRPRTEDKTPNTSSNGKPQHGSSGSSKRQQARDNISLPSPTKVSLPPPRRPLPPHQLILAPMVGGSELAFRLLARRHGAQLCYTPMIRCEEFSRAGAGVNLLERHADDAPLVAHFSGNDPAKLLDVAKKAERCKGVVAIDLNLGCPQRSAHSGHFGAFLLDACDRALLLKIVSTLSRGLSVPFFCKIRLLDDLGDTLTFVDQLQAAGCALLAVHGRYRGSPMHRRDGPAHLDQIALIKQRLSIPVVTNGNVRNAAELLDSLVATKCDGVMSAEGALDDPSLFEQACASHLLLTTPCHSTLPSPTTVRVAFPPLTTLVCLTEQACTLNHAKRKSLKRQVKAAKALKQEKKQGKRTLTAAEEGVLQNKKAAKAQLASLPELPKPSKEHGGAQGPPHAGAGGGNGGGGSSSSPTDAGADDASMDDASMDDASMDAADAAALALADEYLALVKQYPPPGGKAALLTHTVFHVRRLLKQQFNRFELMDVFKASSDLEGVAQLVASCREYASGRRTFEPATEAARRAEQAVATRRAANAARRADFVERMRSKAKAEGKRDVDHYLRAGRAPPTAAELERAKSMLAGKVRSKWWRERYGQHCEGHYLDGTCPHLGDARGCGFLHGDEMDVCVSVT